MATVKKVERYVFDGVEYESLKKLKEEVENQLGRKVVDKIVNVCPPAKMGDVLKILSILTDKETRDDLIKLLTVKYEVEYRNLDGGAFGQSASIARVKPAAFYDKLVDMRDILLWKNNQI